MKKIIFCCIILSFGVVESQQKKITISWNGSKSFSTPSKTENVPHFNPENFNYSADNGLKYHEQWRTDRPINEKSIRISNETYAPISSAELKDVDIRTIPNRLNVKLQNSVDRGVTKVLLEVSPIIKEDNQFKKLTGFTLSYDWGTSQLRNSLNTTGITNSVLSQGQWYKFFIDTTGVFKLSRNFLKDIGVPISSIDPRNIKLFGQGGAMLPFENSVGYPFDLKENAIKLIGEADGTFDDNDYILFYGVGSKGYNSESNTNINAYTDSATYYINVSSGRGKRIQDGVEPSGNPNLQLDTFQEYQFHEIDEYNLAKMGRRWFGNRFDYDNSKTFEFEFENIITTEPIHLKVLAAAVSEVQTTMSVDLNGVEIDNFLFNQINDPILATEDQFEGDLTVGTPNIAINLNYNNNGNPSSLGYLDYISIEATRALTHTGDQFLFKNKAVITQSGIGQYNINNAQDVLEVWDVTNKYEVTTYKNLDENSTFSFKAQLGQLRSYIALDPSDYYEPKQLSNSNVANQNIKGTVFLNDQGQFQDIDYIIVTRADMISQAERLAQINRIQNGLNVKVYSLDHIYTEFSSGNQDVSAIRNFMKYVYDNASSAENRIKYLCLFGDASFDYKDRISGNTNIVPSWYSLNSFSLSGSFISDDFYGMMDDNEGGMQTSDMLDIAVGRVLADTPQRAKELVDKIESYYVEEAYGSWRNNVITVADDVDLAWETIIQKTLDETQKTVTAAKPFFNFTKIYADAYVQESTAGGERYPSVNKAIFDAIEVGAVVVNYFGHGGEDGLARERIFDKINAQELKNPCKLNCFVTVTCEYTKFDNPLRETAGEYLYWNKQGGAIGLITTTRQIFVSVGVAFNKVLDQYLFALGTSEYLSVAEALRQTKNNNIISGIQQKRLVFYIGDPAMKLAFPKPNIRLTKVNDTPVGGGSEVLQALSQAKIEGEIVDQFGNPMPNYNGVLTATIYDKEIDRSTLGNDGTTQNGELIILDFKTLGEIIFRGQATITNGQFGFNFVVPRDIGIPVGNGKVSFYAKAENGLDNQSGSSYDIEIGGLNTNAPEDNEGPVISLFMNDENFISGGITNESPTLLAKLVDENGINTASGIGHDIVAIIDGDEANPFKLNDYYQADVDDYQNGNLSYPFRDLEPGLHTLTLKAWDVYNNSSISELQFVVYDENESLVIENVLNYPNPFVNYTEFWFNHNSSGVLDVSVQIFTVSGKLVKTIIGQTTGGAKNTSSVSRDLSWDGRDDFGDKIGKGVYVYKLKVRSNQLNKQVEKIQKLVIL
ncbi:MAG: type IX secretion system sortase PorU [Flavobacteriaceae bacterium]|nr:type IX secretion system sortase PorU [Flavobacteriaceae bacterium]